MIRAEQIVYGTFPFTQGFTLVGRSPGTDPETAQKAVDACRDWGEVLDPEFRSALFHVTTDDDPPLHLVGKVIRQGRDAGGRIAWYQQVLILGNDDYLAAGADFFAFDSAGIFKDRWFQSDSCESMQIPESAVPPWDYTSLRPDQLEMALQVAKSACRGAEVRFTAKKHSRDISRIIRAALRLAPRQTRARLEVATFAFRPVRHYHIWAAYDTGADSNAGPVVAEGAGLKPPEEEAAEIVGEAGRLIRKGEIEKAMHLLGDGGRL